MGTDRRLNSDHAGRTSRPFTPLREQAPPRTDPGPEPASRCAGCSALRTKSWHPAGLMPSRPRGSPSPPHSRWLRLSLLPRQADDRRGLALSTGTTSRTSSRRWPRPMSASPWRTRVGSSSMPWRGFWWLDFSPSGTAACGPRRCAPPPARPAAPSLARSSGSSRCIGPTRPRRNGGSPPEMVVLAGDAL